jgi:hypothetical protein
VNLCHLTASSCGYASLVLRRLRGDESNGIPGDRPHKKIGERNTSRLHAPAEDQTAHVTLIEAAAPATARRKFIFLQR